MSISSFKKVISTTLIIMITVPIFAFSAPQKTYAIIKEAAEVTAAIVVIKESGIDPALIVPTIAACTKVADKLRDYLAEFFDSAVTGLATGAVTGAASGAVSVTRVPVASQDIENNISNERTHLAESRFSAGFANQEIKEGCYDAIAKAIARTLLQTMTESVINWINSGFEGDPSFMENPKDFFTDVGNEVTGAFIDELGLGFLCEPFGLQIQIALATSDYFVDRAQCTVLDVIDNYDAFMDDFSQGGWAGWISITQNPQNNPYGAYLIAKSELDRRIAEAVGFTKDEMSDGFFPLKECVEYDQTPDNWSGNMTGMGDYTGPHRKGGIEGCTKVLNITPAQLISSQTNFFSSVEARNLLTIDEVDEAISAILNALINKLITDGLKGLTDENKESTWTNSTEQVDTSKNLTLAKITKLIGSIDSFLKARQESVRIINEEIIPKIEDVISCYSDNDKQFLWSARNTEKTKYEDLANTYNDEINVVKGNEPELIRMKELLGNNPTQLEVNEIFNEFISLDMPTVNTMISADNTNTELNQQLIWYKNDLTACQSGGSCDNSPGTPKTAETCIAYESPLANKCTHEEGRAQAERLGYIVIEEISCSVKIGEKIDVVNGKKIDVTNYCFSYKTSEVTDRSTCVAGTGGGSGGEGGAPPTNTNNDSTTTADQGNSGGSNNQNDINSAANSGLDQNPGNPTSAIDEPTDALSPLPGILEPLPGIKTPDWWPSFF